MSPARPTALDLITGPGHVPFTRQMARDMSETTLQNHILGEARDLGWSLRYHTYDSRKSAKGFPDLVLVHERQRRVIFSELKKETGRQSTEQEDWERGLLAVGQEFYLWRPTDWLNRTVTRILLRRPA